MPRYKTLEAGTRVRLIARLLNGEMGVTGYVIDADRYGSEELVQVLTDGGISKCIARELIVLEDRTPAPEPMRYRLPYENGPMRTAAKCCSAGSISPCASAPLEMPQRQPTR